MTADSQRPRLREYRQQLGWTQQELADRLAHLAWIKHRKRAAVKLTELERSGHYPGAIDALRHVLAPDSFRPAWFVRWRRPPPPARQRERHG